MKLFKDRKAITTAALSITVLAALGAGFALTAASASATEGTTTTTTQATTTVCFVITHPPPRVHDCDLSTLTTTVTVTSTVTLNDTRAAFYDAYSSSGLVAKCVTWAQFLGLEDIYSSLGGVPDNQCSGVPTG